MFYEALDIFAVLLRGFIYTLNKRAVNVGSRRLVGDGVLLRPAGSRYGLSGKRAWAGWRRWCSWLRRLRVLAECVANDRRRRDRRGRPRVKRRGLLCNGWVLNGSNRHWRQLRRFWWCGWWRYRLWNGRRAAWRHSCRWRRQWHAGGLLRYWRRRWRYWRCNRLWGGYRLHLGRNRCGLYWLWSRWHWLWYGCRLWLLKKRGGSGR